MDNKVIGLIIMLTVLFGLTYMVTQGDVFGFISAESVVLILGVGGGMTYMRKHKINDDELGSVLNENFVLAGWLGALVGLITMLPNVGFGDENFRIGLSYAILPILYGYVLGKIAHAFLEK